jgi:hypothetical protein
LEKNNQNNRNQKINSPTTNGTLPHQINAPIFENVSESERKPFINSHGVVIGDSNYDSPNSPLNQWSEETDPAIMSGDEWIHPTNDIGWNTDVNRKLAEDGENPKDVPFMHPTKDVSYLKD